MVFRKPASELETEIRAGRVKIAVIGLGQVGLPLALHLAREGASVIGVDADEQKMDLIKQGVCPLSTGYVAQLFSQVWGKYDLEVTTEVAEAASKSRVHIICVPTPLASNKLPDLSAVKSVSRAVGSELKRGDLVVLESTVYPGVTIRVVKPILERLSGLKVGVDFGLAYCFERLDPGNTEHRLDNTPRVIGAVDKQSMRSSVALYRLIIKTPVLGVANCETAELVKLVENVYRDMNIAFANELALLCQRLNIDVLEVIGAAATKWNFMPHLPGAGVGGSCIPVSPYYLLECARGVGLDLKLVRQTREINEGMPLHVVELAEEALAGIGKPVKGARVCLLGFTYKADVADISGAPAKEIAKRLVKLGAKVVGYDPLVTKSPHLRNMANSLEEAVKDSDCIIITTEHSSFKSLDLKRIVKLAHTPLAIVDGRHVLIPREAQALGIAYIGLGRSQSSNLNVWDMMSKIKKPPERRD